MRKTSLTSNSEYINGRLVHRYDFDGLSIPVHDSAKNMLLVIELFADTDLGQNDKTDILGTMLFPDPLEVIKAVKSRFGDLLISILWDACGLDLKGEQAHEAPIFDFGEDAARIKASLLLVYGIDWESASESMAYWEFCDLLSELLECETDNPFKQAVYYRSASEPKRTEHNGEYVDAWRARARHFALNKIIETSDHYTDQDHVAGDIFAALRAAAEGGR